MLEAEVKEFFNVESLSPSSDRCAYSFVLFNSSISPAQFEMCRVVRHIPSVPKLQ